MSKVEDFLTADEEQEIVNAILESEKNTSGEIRVHIETSTSMDHSIRAQEVFHLLKMDNTKESNGVLIYVAVGDKKFESVEIKGLTKWFRKTSGNRQKISFRTISKKENIKKVLLMESSLPEKN